MRHVVGVGFKSHDAKTLGKVIGRVLAAVHADIEDDVVADHAVASFQG